LTLIGSIHFLALNEFLWSCFWQIFCLFAWLQTPWQFYDTFSAQNVLFCCLNGAKSPPCPCTFLLKCLLTQQSEITKSNYHSFFFPVTFTLGMLLKTYHYWYPMTTRGYYHNVNMVRLLKNCKSYLARNFILIWLLC